MGPESGLHRKMKHFGEKAPLGESALGVIDLEESILVWSKALWISTY